LSSLLPYLDLFFRFCIPWQLWTRSFVFSFSSLFFKGSFNLFLLVRWQNLQSLSAQLSFFRVCWALLFFWLWNQYSKLTPELITQGPLHELLVFEKPFICHLTSIHLQLLKPEEGALLKSHGSRAWWFTPFCDQDSEIKWQSIVGATLWSMRHWIACISN